MIRRRFARGFDLAEALTLSGEWSNFAVRGNEAPNRIKMMSDRYRLRPFGERTRCDVKVACMSVFGLYQNKGNETCCSTSSILPGQAVSVTSPSEAPGTMQPHSIEWQPRP
jgi:hypothetical protein